MKGLVKQMKRQATEWEKIIVGHISDKGFASRIYKELSKVNSKKEKKKLIHTIQQENEQRTLQEIYIWQTNI